MQTDPPPPRVGIVVLNWYGRPDTLECLRSLVSLEYPNYFVLLIDNGCEQFSATEVSSLVPGGRYLHTDINRGFAGGVNIGAREALAAGADYVLLVNNDAVVEPGSLVEMVRVAKSEPTVGVVGAKLLRMDAPRELECAGVRVNLKWGRLYEMGFREPDCGQYDHSTAVTAVSGAGMLLSRALCDRLGGLDERYFCYLEDVDLCLRATRAGFKIRLAPGARFRHKGKGSSGSTLSLYYATRNHLMLMHEHGLGSGRRRLLREVAIVTLNAAYALRADWSARPARLRAVWRGVRDYQRGVIGPARFDATALT